jgi:hypothetical protein
MTFFYGVSSFLRNLSLNWSTAYNAFHKPPRSITVLTKAHLETFQINEDTMGYRCRKSWGNDQRIQNCQETLKKYTIKDTQA